MRVYCYAIISLFFFVDMPLLLSIIAILITLMPILFAYADTPLYCYMLITYAMILCYDAFRYMFRYAPCLRRH